MPVQTTEAEIVTGVTPVDGASVTPPQADANTPETVETLPEWAQRHIKNLRQENENRRKQEADNRRKAEEDKLAAEAKWQQLAEARGQEVEMLKGVSERYERLSAQLQKQIETEIDGWPDEVKTLKPTGDAEALLAWAEKARPIVTKLRSAGGAAGQGATPKPSGSMAGATTEAARKDFERMVRRL